MSKVCPVTLKAPRSGHNVSHANNKTKRRFLPNLQTRRIWVATLNRFIKVRLSTKGLRTIDKLGIDAVLAKIAFREIN